MRFMSVQNVINIRHHCDEITVHESCDISCETKRGAMAKDIDSVFQIVEIPLDGAQRFPQLGSGPVKLVSRDRRDGGRCRNSTAYRCVRRRNRDILQLVPAPVQAAVLVQRLAHLAKSNNSRAID